jgi:glutamate---cysteine ligase / carboxylate-amine ligase
MRVVRKVGVEEELLLVDPDTGELANAAGHVLHEHRTERKDEDRPASQELEGELLRHMVETHTDPTTDLRRVERELQEARRTAMVAADDSGLALAAVGTAPLGSIRPAVSANPRYERIVNEFGEMGRGAGTLGMHVHIDIDDDEEGVRVIDAVRPWLPLLTALSSNSPYAAGRDTGYASWRQQVWTRWPTAGTAEPYGSAEEYRRVTRTLIDIGAALDAGMLYFDARLSTRYPTVEIRVADTCTEIEDAMVVVALARALVETLAEADPPARPWRSDVLRGAWWLAARYGLSGRLVHPVTARSVVAHEAVMALRELVDDALQQAGDADRVDEGLSRLSTTGTGARRQRATYERTGEIRDVVADLVARTTASAQSSS